MVTGCPYFVAATTDAPASGRSSGGSSDCRIVSRTNRYAAEVDFGLRTSVALAAGAGASRECGLAAAQALIDEGARVVLCRRRAPAIERARDRGRRRGPGVLT